MIFGRMIQLAGILVLLFGLIKLVAGAIGTFSNELELAEQLGQFVGAGLVNLVIVFVGAAIFQHGGEKVSVSKR